MERFIIIKEKRAKPQVSEGTYLVCQSVAALFFVVLTHIRETWLKCTRRARALPEDAFHTANEPLRGYRSQQPISWNSLRNWPRRDWHPLRSVFILETWRECLKLRKSRAPKSYAFLRRKEWLPRSQKTSTIWSKKQSAFANILIASVRTLLPSSDSFLWKAESTDSLATTSAPSSCLPLSSIALKLLPPSWVEPLIFNKLISHQYNFRYFSGLIESPNSL